MSIQKHTTLSFDIKAQVTYSEAESRPDSGLHFFIYQISITNKSNCPAQLMSRHWIISDGTGKIEEVRGAGVGGLQPKIQPNQTFQYESAAPLTSPTGTMKGTYQMLTENGELVDIEIPEFYLISPLALN
ncbi:MAG: protein ApaG [Oligoflexia bacterium]|nr:MAG: protein ApaG [Oligoflexia bacterium]